VQGGVGRACVCMWTERLHDCLASPPTVDVPPTICWTALCLPYLCASPVLTCATPVR